MRVGGWVAAEAAPRPPRPRRLSPACPSNATTQPPLPPTGAWATNSFPLGGSRTPARSSQRPPSIHRPCMSAPSRGDGGKGAPSGPRRAGSTSRTQPSRDQALARATVCTTAARKALGLNRPGSHTLGGGARSASQSASWAARAARWATQASKPRSVGPASSTQAGGTRPAPRSRARPSIPSDIDSSPARPRPSSARPRRTSSSRAFRVSPSWRATATKGVISSTRDRAASTSTCCGRRSRTSATAARTSAASPPVPCMPRPPVAGFWI